VGLPLASTTSRWLRNTHSADEPNDGLFAGRFQHTGLMRQAFAHDAILVIEPEGDERAPGAAVTVALCGHWDHEPPCPLAPHFVHADRIDEKLHIRILFAAEPEMESEVRRRIEQALSGQWLYPEGFTPSWELLACRPGQVSPVESSHAQRLIRD
jgi:hypothetical protein